MTDLIGRDQLRTEINTGSIVVLDALGGSYYEQQHLPGAVALTVDQVDAQATMLLPDKDTAIAVYCSNPACGNSQAVATKLEKLGYTHVRKYREGIQDWTEAGLPVETGVPA